MTIPCPAIEWPSSLEERGPVEDPSIILGARARLGSAALEVLAIRINPGLRRTPDYKKDLPIEVYQSRTVETVLDELEFMTEALEDMGGSTSQSVIELKTGTYLLCVLPAK